MKPETQFKIESVEDIKNHYIRNKDRFGWSLEFEIKNYLNKGFTDMVCNQFGTIYTDETNDFEVVPNPYRTKPEPTCELGKAMKQTETEANKLGMHIEFVFKSNK